MSSYRSPAVVTIGTSEAIEATEVGVGAWGVGVEGIEARLALDIARRFIFGAFWGILAGISGSAMLDGNGVGGGGRSGVGQVTMLLTGEGGLF